MRSPLAGQDNGQEPPSTQGDAAGGAAPLGQTAGWTRKKKQPTLEEVAPVQAAVTETDNDRFRPSKLSPVGEVVNKRPRAVKGKQREETLRQKPLRMIDRALLVVEVMAALVVAWLVVQYVYTVYFDTAPRRVSPRPAPVGGQLSGGVAKATPSIAPTRFVEVAPPLSGGPGGESVSTATPTATPTSLPLVMRLPSRLRIPVMVLDSPVHEVSVNMGTWEVSPMDIGHHTGTGNPGEFGNVVLAGHRDINSALFRELDRLEPGDEVYVSNSLGEYRYIVQESLVVSPDYVEVMDPTDDSRVTLITCTPPGLATQRLVVTAILDRETASR